MIPVLTETARTRYPDEVFGFYVRGDLGGRCINIGLRLGGYDYTPVHKVSSGEVWFAAYMHRDDIEWTILQRCLTLVDEAVRKMNPKCVSCLPVIDDGEYEEWD